MHMLFVSLIPVILDMQHMKANLIIMHCASATGVVLTSMSVVIRLRRYVPSSILCGRGLCRYSIPLSARACTFFISEASMATQFSSFPEYPPVRYPSLRNHPHP
jgi:hypothetical protein